MWLSWILISLGLAFETAPGYRLGPGDRIALQLDDLKEIEFKAAEVEADGRWSSPMRAGFRRWG